MSYKHRELQITYTPGKGWYNFVLYVEPKLGFASTSLNAAFSLERPTACVDEWRGRLQRCEPNALHTTLVESRTIPDLFHPCVDEDPDSPSAIGGKGCVCYQTWYDPEFGLPVVAHHHRTVRGRTDQWKYLTYAPLELRPDDTFASFVIDHGYFWIRTTEGVLSILPQKEGRGYGMGYGGGGPYELARYLQKLIDSDGQDTAAGSGSPAAVSQPDRRLVEWVTSDDVAWSQELTLKDLKKIRHG